MAKFVVKATIEGVSQVAENIREILAKNKIKEKEINETMLIFEESTLKFIEYSTPEDNMIIKITGRYGACNLSIICHGKEFKEKNLFLDLETLNNDVYEEDFGLKILYAYRDRITYSRKDESNYLNIAIGKQERVFAKNNLIGMVLGFTIAFATSFVLTGEQCTYLCDNLLGPIEEIYVKLLQLIGPPLIFVSTMTSVAKFTSFPNVDGKIRKTLVGCFGTSILACLAAIGAEVFIYNNTFVSKYAGALSEMVNPTEAVKSSTIMSSIVEAVPNNIIEPFISGNPVHLLVVSAIFGIAFGKIRESRPYLQNLIEGLEALLQKVVEIVFSVTPFASFVIAIYIVYYYKMSMLLYPLVLILVIALALFGIMVFYLTLVAIRAKVNPFIMLKKMRPYMKHVFFVGSPKNVITDTISFCEKELGVPKRISAFSIPFSAIANFDGTCIYIIATGLLLAELCGVDLFGGNMLSMIFTVFILSIGSPITPGSAMLAILILIQQMGVSVYVLGMPLLINAFIEMLLSCLNVFGDIALSVSISGSEGILRKDVYNSQKSDNKKESA